MGNRDARRQKTARIDNVSEVKPVPVEIPAIGKPSSASRLPRLTRKDCDDEPKSRPNKADLKRLKKERKKRQHAPLPPQILIRAKDVQAQIEPTLPNANLVPQLALRLQPDFSKPTSPSDRLFETDDEMLFWFSSGHLARVSPFFRDLFDLSLHSPYSIVGTDGGSTTAPIPLHDTNSHGLALLFHVLLFEFTAYPVLPNDVLGLTFLGALVHAHELALRFDITLFAPIIAPFVVRHARVLRLTKPFEAFTLALVTEDPVLSNEVIWLTLAHPLYSIPQEVFRFLEERYPDGLARLQQLHENVKPASLNLQYRMEFDDIPELPPN
jgi:hypothetical protein